MKIVAFAFMTLLAAGPAAATPITLTFVSSTLTTTPGTDVTFDATLENPTASDEYLNGDSFTFPLPVDDLLFFLNFPAVLSPGVSFTAPILTVSVAGSTLPGLYSGVFNVIGGATASSIDVLATQTFAVNVVAAPTAVPEPGTLSLIAVGPFAAAVRAIRRRRRS